MRPTATPTQLPHRASCAYWKPEVRPAVMAVMGKVKTSRRRMDTNQPLDVLLLQLNRRLRGWCAHFRPGVSSATFTYLI